LSYLVILEGIASMESQNNHPGERDTSQGGNGGKPDNSGDTARITNKQLNYTVNLGRNIGWNSTDLDRESTKIFGMKMAYLSPK